MKISVHLAVAMLLASSANPAHAQATAGPESQISSTSPLRSQESKLLAASDAVRYYVVKSVFPKSGVSEGRFRYLPESDRAELTSQAFYTAALRRAVVRTWSQGVVDILDALDPNSEAEFGAKAIMLKAEKEYFRENHFWPDMSAVDVDRIVDRLSESHIIN